MLDLFDTNDYKDNWLGYCIRKQPTVHLPVGLMIPNLSLVQKDRVDKDRQWVELGPNLRLKSKHNDVKKTTFQGVHLRKKPKSYKSTIWHVPIKEQIKTKGKNDTQTIGS